MLPSARERLLVKDYRTRPLQVVILMASTVRFLRSKSNSARPVRDDEAAYLLPFSAGLRDGRDGPAPLREIRVRRIREGKVPVHGAQFILIGDESGRLRSLISGRLAAILSGNGRRDASRSRAVGGL
jgi:hypothetical protein